MEAAKVQLFTGLKVGGYYEILGERQYLGYKGTPNANKKEKSLELKSHVRGLAYQKAQRATEKSGQTKIKLRRSLGKGESSADETVVCSCFSLNPHVGPAWSRVGATGFSLHAAVSWKGHQNDKCEKLMWPKSNGCNRISIQ